MMKKLLTFAMACYIVMPCSAKNPNQSSLTNVTSESVSDSTYTVTVNTPGTFGQMVLQEVENWSDIAELTVKGSLNEDDMVYFARLQNMRKLDLSQTDITTIGGCKSLSSLKTVILPNTVTDVLSYAFYGCSALSSINLDNITQIGGYAFTNCSSMPRTLDLPNLLVIEGNSGDYFYGTFSSCRIDTINMPKVEEIGRAAFSGSSVKIANMPNVKEIGSYAFYESALTAANIANCDSLGQHCFRGCVYLSTVVLSDNLETIPYEAFSRTAITNIVLPKSLKEIGHYAFQYAPLANIDIPEGVTTIGGEAFHGCPLKTITLPSTLEYIGGEAFYYTQEEYNSSTRKYEYSYVLEDVYCKSVVPLATTTFNSEMSKGATLHVPAFSVSAYKLDDNWYMFGKVEALDGNLQDITINNDFTIVDYTGLADKPNLTITSTSTESSSSSSITAGHLTVSGSAALSLGEFVQKQERYEEKDYVYDENGRYSYVYTYPYCTTLIPNNEMRADAVTTKISMPTDMWSFISLPYDVSVADIEVPGNTMWVVRKYNGENRAAMSGDTWQNVESGQTLNAGEGYIFHCVSTDDDSDGYVEFTFPAVNNSNKNNVFAYADVTTTLNEYAAEFSHNRGWNLVGNPYPCYYNSHNLEFSAPITIWNGSGYTAYSLADDEYVMSPNEAFFVQCPINGTSIKFAKEGRQHEYSNTAVDNNTRAKAVVDRHILNFVVSDGKYNDRARIVINDEAKAEYEIERDASKFFSSQSNVPQVYVVDNGVNYAIDERPIGTGTFSLGVRLGQEGQYTFSMNAKDFDGDALLTDNETGKITNLAKESYTFTAQSQAYENRFSVSISGSGITSIQHTNIDGQAFSLDGKTLTFNSNYGNVSIVSADGKTIYKGVPSSPITLQKGIYVVSTDNGSSKIAVK